MIQAETLELLEWSRLCQHLSTFAATKLGAIAARRLRIPDTKTETLTLLAQTQEVYALENRLSTGLKFDGITDIGESLERAERRALLSGEELLAIATTLAGMRQLRRVIDNQPDLTVLKALIEELRTYPELEQEIHRCIDDRGQVADRATPKLAGIREQQKQLRDRVYSTLQNILQRKANAVQESLITQREGRFVIPVKAPQKDAIPGIVHDTSMSGATLYIEPQATVNLNNQLRQLQRQEQVEEEAVRQALTNQVAAVKPDLERLLAIATTLDLATARARYSLWLEANPPHFITRDEDRVSTPHTPHPTSESIVLRHLRHPLLIWQQQHEQGRPVVPIDLVIQPHIRVVAITGPNTGGKTVTLKTLGLAVLMAKVGLFVPAREPVELPWFDQVLADIGDEQSLEQSLSTFSGHIRRISRILAALRRQEAEGRRQEAGGRRQEAGGRRQEAEGLGEAGEAKGAEGAEGAMGEQDLAATPYSPLPTPHSPLPTPYSLVLLDEVGAGTDPSEGSALAIALLNHLADHAGLTIATTHFGELKALKYQDDRFENASVEFDNVSLSPTYRLLWGIPGRSNALTIASRLGLDGGIVAQAQALVGGASDDVNQVIAGLEAQRRRQETKSQEAAQLLESVERLHRELSRKAASLKEREQSLQQAQEQAVQTAIAQAKSEIAQVIRQLQQGPVSAQAAQQATDSLNQLAEHRLPSRQPKPPKPGFRPQVGDRVRLPRLGQTAEVLTAPNDDEEITVRFGLMKMTVSLDDVESLEGEKVEKRQKAEGRGQKGSEVGEAGEAEGGKGRQTADGRRQTAALLSTPHSPLPTPHSPIIRTSSNTIDIRGTRVADAEPMMEQAIAQAYNSGVLWIIHGHGTGKLRQGVHAFLQHHPQVERYELASRADGGAGVTIAYLH